MISAGTSGGCGDIVYSIPVMKKLDITRLHVKENWYKPGVSLYSVMKGLLESQGLEVVPTAGGYDFMEYEPGLKLDYDMDGFRQMPGRGHTHIMLNMLKHFGLAEDDWKQPWLEVPTAKGSEEYSLIHLTPRWRKNSKVDWAQVLTMIEGHVFFIGFEEEHKEFCRLYGDIGYLPTEDILQMAQLIKGCKALYCNQSVALALAQSMGKTYYLEVKPHKTNTLMRTANENILE
jgi:hypothetical protein